MIKKHSEIFGRSRQLDSNYIHDFIDQNARDHACLIALKFQSLSLSYSELGKLTDKLAAYFVSQGVGANTFVAVCLERSIELVLTLLAVIKAGGAYVPLDPSYPDDRLSYMLENSQAKLCVSTHKLSSSISALENLGSTVVVDINDALNQPVNIDLLKEVKISPADAAYMIYTSGSTGKPKGVVVEHLAIANRLEWMQDQFQLKHDDVVLQKTPYSFDVSVWEFFWPLREGACLVVAEPGGHQDVRYLESLIQSEKVTTLHFVPSMFQLFLSSANVRELVTLRRVICSGEALPKALVENFSTQTKADLFNLYGPTEAAVDVTYWDCRQASPCLSIPIGFPIDNIALYVLNEALHCVEVGTQGELYIGGVGLARGYYRNEALTKERFQASRIYVVI